jgi:hypothetical protein
MFSCLDPMFPGSGSISQTHCSSNFWNCLILTAFVGPSIVRRFALLGGPGGS